MSRWEFNEELKKLEKILKKNRELIKKNRKLRGK
jgi:hypothetical protein